MYSDKSFKNGIVNINGEGYFQIISDGTEATNGMIDFMTKDKSIRIIAFPEGGGDYFDEHNENQYWEIGLYKRETGKLYENLYHGYYEYIIDGLFTIKEFEIFKKNFVIDKTFTIDTNPDVCNDKEYQKGLNRELKTMLLTEY